MSSISNKEQLKKINELFFYPQKDTNTIKIIPNQKKLNDQSINKLEDYTEIIPQKTQTIQENFLNLNDTLENENENQEENFDNQNLDFSFGKELQKDNTTINTNNNKDNNCSEKTDANTNVNSFKNKLNNTFNQDIFDKKNVFSENLSSYQFTDSLSNYNIEENKKLKLIREKFVSNFKNKNRSTSLQKALQFFEKYQNYQKFNLNHSFSNLKDIPFKNLITQNTDSLSFLDNKKENKKINKNISVFNKLENNDNNKKNENINIINNDLKMKKGNILKTFNIKINNKKLILKKIISRKKGQNKKLTNLKSDKKKGFYIRKVIREEKYFVDDDGKEKIIGIKQSTFDSQEKNIKKDLATKKSLSNNNNLTLLNKKKFAEYIKEKISNKKDNKSILFQNKNPNNLNKNIKINTDFINNNKQISVDNRNNIKIVINKINKLNSNPKIKLNIIKKYKNKEQNYLNSKENDNENTALKTEVNDHNAFHLIKIDKFKGENKLEYKPLLTNINLNTYQDREILNKLKFLKCEKVDKLQHHTLDKKIINSNKNIYFSNPKLIPQKTKKRNIRNHSYKEIRNLSNNKDNHSSNREIIDNKNKFLTIELNNNNKYKFKQIPNKNSPNKNKKNHTFYESKSFSSKKKTIKKLKPNEKQKIMKIFRYRNENNKIVKNINNEDYKPINTNRNYFCKSELNNNLEEDTNNNLNTINTNNNLNTINTNNLNIINNNIYTSFNTNIYYSYNNKKKNKLHIHC